MKRNHLLREARLKKGWSQQQLADFAGLSLSTVERAERGNPFASTAFRGCTGVWAKHRKSWVS